MAKQQFFSLLATAFLLGANQVELPNANASTISSNKSHSIQNQERSPDLSPKDQYRLAQKPASNKNSNPDDEMLDALQQRQEKLDRNLDKLRKLTGTESEAPETEQAPLTEEEMIDAINSRQQKIQELKKLKKLKDIAEQEDTLEALQEQDFNVNTLEELETVRGIISDRNLDREQMLEALQQQNLNIDLQQLKQLRKIVGTQPAIASESTGMSSTLAFRIWTVGLPATILVFLVATPFVKGIAGVVKSNYQEKYGKPPVPEGSASLHNRALKEITLIGNKAKKINNDKFGSEEFLLLVKIKINMYKEAEGYRGLGKCVDLLEAAIIAQKSFLRLEQTELRYRSRKQQEFYQHVADILNEDIDREDFAEKIDRKQTDILPAITTEEGKAAIATYVKELKILSKYKLGLKLLALFKQYELKDFSILKRVSDVVEGFQGVDLISSDNLISPVLENYESFEKLGPILGICEAESTPKAYAKILQVIGLTNRHGKAYREFEQLVELLKKWEKPYKTIAMIREEYTEDKYTLPSEFKEDIPGKSTYQKYAEYLADL